MEEDNFFHSVYTTQIMNIALGITIGGYFEDYYNNRYITAFNAWYNWEHRLVVVSTFVIWVILFTYSTVPSILFSGLYLKIIATMGIVIVITHTISL